MQQALISCLPELSRSFQLAVRRMLRRDMIRLLKCIMPLQSLRLRPLPTFLRDMALFESIAEFCGPATN